MYRGIGIAATIEVMATPLFCKRTGKKELITLLWQDTFMVGSSCETKEILFYSDIRSNLGAYYRRTFSMACPMIPLAVASSCAYCHSFTTLNKLPTPQMYT